MKRFIKGLFTAAAISLLFAGCSTTKINDQLRYKVLVESFEGITTSPSGGWVIKLRVNNQTSHQPTLHFGEGEIYVDNTLTAHAKLQQPVTLPKKAVSSISIPLEITVHSPLKVISLMLRVKDKNYNGVDIAFKASVEMVGKKRNIEVGKTPVNTILNKLGYK